MDKINIGKIVNVVGLKGEVKIFNFSSSKERYEKLRSIYIEDQKYEIEKVRYNKNTVILKLFDTNDRTSAEVLKDKNIFISESDLAKLPEGEYYVRDMIGMTVICDDETAIGTLKDVLQNKGHDLYEIEMQDGKMILVPAVEEFILNIDIEKKQMNIKLIEGLI
jgi:16S rRNA processing protein RimM